MESSLRDHADLRGRALWVVLGCLVCQMGLGFGYAWGALAPEMLEDLGWSRAAFSSVRAPQLWVIALASPLVGAAVGRFGGRTVLLWSVAALGVLYAALSRVQELWQLSLLILPIGLGLAGVGDIAAGAVVAQWLTRSRGLALGIVYAGSNLGGAGVVALVGVVLAHGSWRDGFLAIAALALLAMLPFAAASVRDRGTPVVDVGPVADAGAVDLAPGDLDSRAALRTRSFWILTFSLLSFWFYFLAMLDHLVLFLTDEGVENARGYFANAILVGVVSKVGFGWIADRLGAWPAVLLDYALLAASSLLLLALPRPELLWPFVLVYGFAVAARDVATPLLVDHCFGVRSLAQIYGWLMLTLLPGGTLGPAFAGLVHDRTGSYDLAFQVFAALNLLSFGLLFLVRDERPRISRRAPSAAA